MDLTTELARFNPDPALRDWVADTVGQLLDQAQRDARALKAAELKIQALVLELAYRRRMQFGNKSEQLSPEQHDLFQETANTDLSAIEAEIEQQAAALSPQPKRARAGRQPLPEHLATPYRNG